MATGFTDFSDDTVEQAPEGWTFYDFRLDDTVVATVEELEDSLSGQALSLKLSAFGKIAAVWDDSEATADGEVVALVRPAGNASGWDFEGPAARMDGADPPTMVTGIVRSANNNLSHGYHDGSDTIAIVGTAESATVDAGDRWWIRHNFDGTTLKTRYWKEGEEEPETWNHDDTDAGVPTSSGKFGVVAYTDSGDRTCWVEALGWSDDPSVSAPTSGGGGGGGSETPRSRTRGRIVTPPPFLLRGL